MPYIKDEEKKQFDEVFNLGRTIVNPGQLNYVFTNILLGYLSGKNVRYQYINDIIGALEGAKLEFYRRYVSEYETRKIKQNGDVY